MNVPPTYQIIYNWDGAPHGYSPVPQTLEQFLDGVFAPLIDTQVDALFWCIGEHTARWQSENLEQIGEVHGRRYENAAAYIHSENILRMLERGEDPHSAIIKLEMLAPDRRIALRTVPRGEVGAAAIMSAHEILTVGREGTHGARAAHGTPSSLEHQMLSHGRRKWEKCR